MIDIELCYSRHDHIHTHRHVSTKVLFESIRGGLRGVGLGIVGQVRL
jgi:hypothetical protein